MTDQKLTLEEMLALAWEVTDWGQTRSQTADGHPEPDFTDYYFGEYKRIQICLTSTDNVYGISATRHELPLGSFKGRAPDIPELYWLVHNAWNISQERKRQSARTPEELDAIKEQYFQEAKQLAKEAMK